MNIEWKLEDFSGAFPQPLSPKVFVLVQWIFVLIQGSRSSCSSLFSARFRF